MGFKGEGALPAFCNSEEACSRLQGRRAKHLAWCRALVVERLL